MRIIIPWLQTDCIECQFSALHPRKKKWKLNFLLFSFNSLYYNILLNIKITGNSKIMGFAVQFNHHLLCMERTAAFPLLHFHSLCILLTSCSSCTRSAPLSRTLCSEYQDWNLAAGYCLSNKSEPQYFWQYWRENTGACQRHSASVRMIFSVLFRSFLFLSQVEAI